MDARSVIAVVLACVAIFFLISGLRAVWSRSSGTGAAASAFSAFLFLGVPAACRLIPQRVLNPDQRLAFLSAGLGVSLALSAFARRTRRKADN